jgi:hypothetical protein
VQRTKFNQEVDPFLLAAEMPTHHEMAGPCSAGSQPSTAVIGSYPLAASLLSFGNFFFPPASGKIHIARIMKAAVANTKLPNSGRTGEPLQRAKTIATMATAAET